MTSGEYVKTALAGAVFWTAIAFALWIFN